MSRQPVRPFRSRDWFADPARADGAADRDKDGFSNLEEYLNELTLAKGRS